MTDTEVAKYEAKKDIRLRLGISYCRRCLKRTRYFYLKGEQNIDIRCDTCKQVYCNPYKR